MKLVEIISNDKTNKEFVDFIDNFLQETLGKGVVHAKDTPNFIANRIGVYGMMVTLDEAKKRRLSIEDVDALTGTLIGRPKSATFRTADVVGLDTMGFVAKTAYDKCLDDEEREIFKVPEYLEKMLENKWLGQKTKQGFYKKISKGVIHSIDLDTLLICCRPGKRPATPSMPPNSTRFCVTGSPTYPAQTQAALESPARRLVLRPRPMRHALGAIKAVAAPVRRGRSRALGEAWRWA